MNSTENTISVVQTLDRIKQLIENEQGDPGRLRYIYEFIQKGKSLYRSDRQYLEKKIHAEIVFEKPTPPSKEDELANSIQKLLHLRIGFPERLQFMLNRIRKNKPIFESDRKYLEKKLEQVPSKFKKSKKSSIKFVLPHKIPTLKEESITKSQLPDPIAAKSQEEIKIANEKISKLQQELSESRNQIVRSETSESKSQKTEELLKIADEKIIKLQQELTESKETIRTLETTIEQKNKEIANKDEEIQKLMKKYSQMLENTSLENIELDKLKEKILDETEKIDKQKLMSEQIKVQKEKLEQLISYRKEYENRVIKEKELLENQIKFENQKIAEKDKIVEDLTKKQEQLERNRIERETILEQVKQEQIRLEEEISRQKEELERAKAEYGDIIDQIDDSDDNQESDSK